MLTITFGIGLTLVLVAKTLLIKQLDMGTMSPGWIAVYHASQPASSI